MSAFDHYVCEGQMSIFDLMPQDMPEDEGEMARIIGNRLGLHFSHDTFFDDWRCKVKGITIDLAYDNYMTDGRRFIGAGVNSGLWGAGSPCDSIDEAVEWLRKQLKCRGVSL